MSLDDYDIDITCDAEWTPGDVLQERRDGQTVEVLARYYRTYAGTGRWKYEVGLVDLNGQRVWARKYFEDELSEVLENGDS